MAQKRREIQLILKREYNYLYLIKTILASSIDVNGYKIDMKYLVDLIVLDVNAHFFQGYTHGLKQISSI